MFGHRVNFGIKLLFDLEYALLVSLSYQIYGETDLSIPSTSSNSVEISSGVIGKVEVDNHIDTLHVNTSRN